MLAHILLIVILTVFVSLAAVYGFISGGSPFELRNKKFDQTRVTKIQALSTLIEGYFTKNRVLPQNIDDLFKDQTNTYGYKREYYQDPETNRDFEYSSKGSYKYEICANFSEDPPKEESNNYYNSYNNKFSEYQKGRYCFNLTILGYENYSTPTPIPATSLIPQATSAPSENVQVGITTINKDGVPYFVIIGAYKDIKSQYEISISTKDKFGDPLEVSVTHDLNRETNVLDKQNKPLKLEKFIVGDKIKVEANVKRGESYDANIIQNLTR